MSLPSSILCPVDFSPGAERALRHALSLAGLIGAHVTIVAVNDPLLVAAAESTGHGEAMRDQVEAALMATLSRVPPQTEAVVPAIDIATGQPGEEILKAAERCSATLIVMGTRGLGMAGRLAFGSTTERVVRDAHIPVLAVPDYSPDRLTVERGAPRNAVGHVVAAIGLDATDTAVAEAAGEWARTLEVPLTLAHVRAAVATPSWWPFALPAPTADAAHSRLQSLARSVDSAASAMIDVRQGEVSGTIGAIVRDRNAGLLVVSRGSGERRLGATAYRLMTSADIPTLVVAGA